MRYFMPLGVTAVIDHKNGERRIDGKLLRLVSIQHPRKTKRKARTKYIYHIEGTNMIVWNRTPYGVRFCMMAYSRKNMSRYYDVFVRLPLTAKEREWLDLYDYELIRDEGNE